MKTCETCKHWSHGPSQKQFCEVLTNLDPEHRIEAYCADSGDLLELVDWVYTPRDFGCIYHVPQE